MLKIWDKLGLVQVREILAGVIASDLVADTVLDCIFTI